MNNLFILFIIHVVFPEPGLAITLESFNVSLINYN